MCMLYLQQKELIQGRNSHQKNGEEGGRDRGLGFAQYQWGNWQDAFDLYGCKEML